MSAGYLMTTPHEQLRRVALAFFAGVGFALTTVVAAHALYPAPEVDYRMEAGCKMPSVEGEMTVAVILDGQFKCWRYR